MMKIKNLRGECQHCKGPIEFHVEATGMTASCPHCGQSTELLPVLPRETRAATPTKAIVYTVIAVVILVGGLISTVVALKRAEQISARQKDTRARASSPPTPKAVDSFVQDNLSVSAVTFEKHDEDSMVYAVGKMRNLAGRRRFGVRIELEVVDAVGSRVGTARDYISVLEPNAEWRFRALVVEKNAVAIRVLSVKETP